MLLYTDFIIIIIEQKKWQRSSMLSKSTYVHMYVNSHYAWNYNGKWRQLFLEEICTNKFYGKMMNVDKMNTLRSYLAKLMKNGNGKPTELFYYLITFKYPQALTSKLIEHHKIKNIRLKKVYIKRKSSSKFFFKISHRGCHNDVQMWNGISR